MNDKIIVERIKVNVKGQVSYLTVEELKQLRNSIDEVLGELETPFKWASLFPVEQVPMTIPNLPNNNDGTAGDKWQFKPTYTICWSDPSSLGQTVFINFTGMS